MTAEDRDMLLKYDTLSVGVVHDVFSSEDTWYGHFETQIDPVASETASRISAFISFCKDWNARIDRGAEHPPSADEFNPFSDIIDSGLWCIVAADGVHYRIDRAPVFFEGDELSWRLVSE